MFKLFSKFCYINYDIFNSSKYSTFSAQIMKRLDLSFYQLKEEIVNSSNTWTLLSGFGHFLTFGFSISSFPWFGELYSEGLGRVSATPFFLMVSFLHRCTCKCLGW